MNITLSLLLSYLCLVSLVMTNVLSNTFSLSIFYQIVEVNCNQIFGLICNLFLYVIVDLSFVKRVVNYEIFPLRSLPDILNNL